MLATCGEDARVDEGTYSNVLRFDTAHVRIVGQRDTIRLVVELAVDEAQKRMGLMERRQLSDTSGMLFVYDADQPKDAGFWMYRTRISLDIAFLDSRGVIRAIRTMVPCEARIPEGCPIYAPDVPYRYALEVNQGFFARRGLAVGDSVTVRDVARVPMAAPTRPSGSE
jgi:uncharacterized protein